MLMAGIDTGYDTGRVLEVLLSTLVQKNVISEQEANFIKQAGKGATFRQGQTGSSRRVRDRSVNIQEANHALARS
jgi:hypothetical protein